MKRSLAIAALCLTLSGVGSARAQFFDDLYRGLQILATPSGNFLTPTGNGGVQNGNRFGRIQFQRNGPGQGWEIQFNRAFGADSTGRPEILDLGAYSLELNGATAFTGSYTTRGVPVGNFEGSISNLNYIMRADTGAQDFELRGTLNGGTALQINAAGFYTARINLTNQVSSLTADGLIVDGNVPTNFDIGPINVKGNIYFDLISSLLGAAGVDTTTINQLFPKSPADQIGASLQQSLDKLLSLRLAEEQTAMLRENAPLDLSTATPGGTLTAAPGGQIPEPAVLGGLATCLLFLLRRR